MVSTEEKDLKKIREDFTKAIKLLKSNKLKEAKKDFEKIIEKNKGSVFTNVMQVRMRSNVYKEFIDFKLTDNNRKIEDIEDLLDEGLLKLNEGKLEIAESYFNTLIEKKYSSAYFNYLLALLNIKKGETETALEYLKMSFTEDETLKVHAFNESDFEDLKTNEDFQEIISL